MAQAADARFGPDRAQAVRDWLLKLEAQRYAPATPASLSTLRSPPPRTGPRTARLKPHVSRRGPRTDVTIAAHAIFSSLAVPRRRGSRPSRRLLRMVHGPVAQKSSNAAAPRHVNPVRGSTPYATRDDAMQFADDVAERRGLDRDWVRATIGSARFLPNVPRLMLPGPVGTVKNWQTYRSRFIDPVRIAAGVRFWRANRADTLARAEQEYGVPPKSSSASSAWRPSTAATWATSA
jgi:hypothetical protein